MTNPAVLERQLLQIALAKGVNERDRPETADPSSTLSRVENLVQDQSGAFVKRPGDTLLGSGTILGGSALNPQRIIRTTDGLVAITRPGFLLQYLEAYGGFARKDQGPQLSVFGADFVASSGATVASSIIAHASSSKYHAVVAFGGVNSSSGQMAVLTIYDIDAGASVAKYNVGYICNYAASILNVKIIWVADRYLMVFTGNRVTSIDMGGTIAPAQTSLRALSAAFQATVAFPDVMDVAANGTRAFILSSHSAQYDITAVTASTCTVNETVAVAAASLPATAHISLEGNDLWYATPAVWGSKNTSNITVQSVAEGTNTLGTLVGYTAQGHTSHEFVVGSTFSLGSATQQRLTFYNGPDPTTVPDLLGKLDGWNAVSNPFSIGPDGDMFIHVNKNNGLELSPHCIISIRPTITTSNNQNYYAFRVEATLEPYNGVLVPQQALPGYRPSTTDAAGNLVRASVAVRTTSRGCAFAVYDVRASSHSKRQAVTFGGNTYIGGGAQSMYDGDRFYEAGFIDMPLMNAAASATAGSILAGLYKYIVVYRSTDANSSGSFSRCSSISSVTAPGAKKTDVSVLPCEVTNRYDASSSITGTSASPVIVDLYRTLSGGTQYYLCASSQVGTPFGSLLTQNLALQGSGIFTVADNLTDTQLATQPTLYRQPGTPNSALDRYTAPTGNLLCQHKDRLFTSDPYGVRVYYSSFFVDGECAWFNPAMSFMVHGGTGPITSIASMDGRLFVFKKDAIFVIDGDGPSESGPSGNEYSPPQRLATEYGCIDARSLCVTTEGIVYRSGRGVEILTRSLQVKWVGDRVQNTLNAYEYTLGSVLDTFGRVHMLIANHDPVSGTVSGQAGAEVVWDIPADAWTIYFHTPSDGTYGHAMQDACLADLDTVGEVIVYADPIVGITYSDYTTGKDRSAYVPWAVETVWIRNGQQTRQKIEDILLLAKKRNNHAIRLSAAYDYVDSYTQVATWQPDTLNLMSIEELNLQILKPQCTALRVLVEEIAPSDQVTYPVGAARGAEILGITANVAGQQGIPQLASYQKCTTGTAVAPGGGPVAWAPTSASVPMLAWYRADSAVQAAGVVSSWPDISGSGDANRNQIPTGAVGYVASDSDYGGKPSVTGDGVNAFLSQGAWSTIPSSPVTIVVVGKSSSSSSLLSTDSGAYDLFWLAGSGLLEFFNSGFGGGFLDATHPTPTSPSVVMYEDDGGGGGAAARLFVNNITTPLSSGISCFSPPAGRLNLMATAAGVLPLTGSEAEVMVFAGILSPTDKANLKAYLNTTRAYGIPVT